MTKVFLGFLDPTRSDEEIYAKLMSSIERAKSVVIEPVDDGWAVRCGMCGMLDSGRTEEAAQRLATAHIQTGRVPIRDPNTGDELWIPVAQHPDPFIDLTEGGDDEAVETP